MSGNRLQRLADDLAAELAEYQQLKTEIAQAQARVTHEPDSFELRAIGSILHDVYSGAEGICQHIAKEIDRRLPVGANWHRDLIDQLAQPLPKPDRPSFKQKRPRSWRSIELFGTFFAIFMVPNWIGLR